MRVLIAGGGTGGHVIPALAIARELRDAHGAEVRFVGTARGLETKLVPEGGFPLELIRVGQLKNVSLADAVADDGGSAAGRDAMCGTGAELQAGCGGWCRRICFGAGDDGGDSAASADAGV